MHNNGAATTYIGSTLDHQSLPAEHTLLLPAGVLQTKDFGRLRNLFVNLLLFFSLLHRKYKSAAIVNCNQLHVHHVAFAHNVAWVLNALVGHFGNMD